MSKLVKTGIYVAIPGDLRITEAVTEAVELAKEEDNKVFFTFNHIFVEVDSDTIPRDAEGKYWDEIAKKSTSPQR